MASTAELAVIITAKDLASGVLNKLEGSLGGVQKFAMAAATGLLAAGTGVAVGLGKSVSVAADFQQVMSGVAAVSGATADDLAKLSAQAIALGQDTTLSGIGAKDATLAMEALAKGGVSVADQLGGATRGALLLASAGGLDVARASEIAANAMNTFKLAGGDVAHIADLFAAAANSSTIEVNDVAMAMAQGGQVAAQFGQSIEETTAVIAAFGAAGLRGSDAGTSMRTTLLALVNPTDKAKAVMEQYGLSFFDANGKMLDFAGIADQLRGHLSGLSDEQRLAALETIFGSDAIRAASVLYDEGGKGILDWTDKVNKSGSAAATGAKRNDNLRGSIEQLKSSIETAQIALGTAFLPLLRQLVDANTRAVNAAIPLITVYGPRLAAALGVGLLALRQFEGAIVALGRAFATGDFNRAFGPFIVAIQTAFGAQAAGAVTLFVSDTLVALQRLRDSVITARAALAGRWLDSEAVLAPVRQIGDAFAALGNVVRPALEAIRNPLGALAEALSALAQQFPALQGPIQAVFGVIAGNAGTVAAVVAGFLALGPAITIVSALLPVLLAGFGALVPVLGVVLSSFGLIADVVGVLGGPLTALAVLVAGLALAWSQNWGNIQGVTATAVATVQGLIRGTLLPLLQQASDFVIGTLVPAWQAGWAQVQATAATVAAVVGPAVQQMADAVVGAFNAALPGLEMFAGGFLMLAQTVEPIVAEVGAYIVSTLEPVMGNIEEWASTVIPQFSAAWAAVWAEIGPVLGDIASGVGIALAAIATFIQEHHDTIVAVLKDAWDVIYNTIGAALTLITGAISVALQLIAGDWSGAWDTMVATVGTAGQQIDAVVAAAFSALLTIIDDATGGAVTRVRNMGAQIVGAVQGLGAALYSAGAAAMDSLIAGFSAKAQAAVDVVRGIVGQIGDLLPHSEPKDPTSPLRGLADSGRALVEMFAAGISDAAPEAVKKVAEVASAIAGAVKSGVDALGAIGGTFGAGAGGTSAFLGALGDLMEKFTTLAGGWEEDVLKAAGEFADTASKAVGVVKGGVDAFKSLADFAAPAEAAVSTFLKSLADFMEKFTTVGGGWEKDVLDQATLFADGTAKSVGIIKGAVDGLEALRLFVAPAQSSVSDFLASLSDLMEKFGTWAGGFEADGLAASATFAEAAGKVTGAVKSALDLFKDLKDAGGFEHITEAMQALDDAVYAALPFIERIGFNLATVAQDLAPKWSDDTGKVIGLVKSVSDLFKDLAKGAGDFVHIPAAMKLLDDAFYASLKYMEEMAFNAAAWELAANTFQVNVSMGVAELKTAFARLQEVPTSFPALPGIPSAGVPISAGGGGGSGGGNSGIGPSPVTVHVNAPVYGVDQLEDVVVTAWTSAQSRGRL